MIIVLIISFLLIPQTFAESTSEPAEINSYIIGEIPTISINNWTAISFKLEDRCGINWSFLKDAFHFEMDLKYWKSNLLHNFKEYRQRFFYLALWKYLLPLPQPIERFLGYTSFELKPTVIGRNIDGWHVKIEPSIILDSATGFNHNFTLFAKVDDSVVDYSVIVEINCTRIDTLGGIYGYSSIYIPLKVAPESYLSVSSLNQKIEVTPKSMNKISFELANKGYYKNVFYLKTDSPTKSLYSSIHQQAAVINPGEKKELTLSFLSPEKIFDFGSPYIIDVYAAHSLNSSYVHIGSLTVVTKGFYLSPLTLIYSVVILILLLTVGCCFYFYYILWQQNTYGRPKKPWAIPEEKQMLRKLKKENKKRYNDTKLMMKQEYKSSLEWYRSFRGHQKIKE